ncbi:hypothetical protein [Paenibacillus maysiensis]|uniref:hypothetical protein n=1 Tax=Paenibacillus maysiensis TaxID=1155954 RepID=UPI00046F51A6|nr:hypothetical protein [Paenibacillus maysiensis]
MKENKQKVAEADRLNFHDRTDDVVREVPATTDASEAVAAMTSHINKYDVPDELEKNREWPSAHRIPCGVLFIWRIIGWFGQKKYCLYVYLVFMITTDFFCS